MSKSKKKAARQQADCEGKYETICRERQERDELDMLNSKTRERVDRMQQELWEQQAKAEYARIMQEKKLKALFDLVLLVIMCAVTCAVMITLAYTGAVAWWISVLLTVGLLMTCSFRSGWLWHEIKK
jgi:cation transport ATPase